MCAVVQWITTCSAANVNIGQLLESSCSLHGTAIACDSRPEHVYIAYADKLHTRDSWYLGPGSVSKLYRMLPTLYMHSRLLRLRSLAFHMYNGRVATSLTLGLSALLNMDSYCVTA